MTRQRRLKEKARRDERHRVEEARKRRAHERLDAFQTRVADGERRGCLFCRRSDGGFKTREHPIPESVGNREIVLDNGVVCDRCNNTVLSDLDQELADFWPLKVRRTMLGVPTKTGKIPVATFSTGSLTNRGGDNLFLKIHGKRDARTWRTTELGGGRVKIDFNFSGGRRMTPRYASRISQALLKACFECAWLDHGEEMLHPAFDHVRNAVLGDPRDGWLVVLRRGDPNDNGLELQYRLGDDDDGRRALVVAGQPLWSLRRNGFRKSYTRDAYT